MIQILEGFWKIFRFSENFHISSDIKFTFVMILADDTCAASISNGLLHIIVSILILVDTINFSRENKLNFILRPPYNVYNKTFVN